MTTDGICPLFFVILGLIHPQMVSTEDIWNTSSWKSNRYLRQCHPPPKEIWPYYGMINHHHPLIRPYWDVFKLIFYIFLPREITINPPFMEYLFTFSKHQTSKSKLFFKAFSPGRCAWGATSIAIARRKTISSSLKLIK